MAGKSYVASRGGVLVEEYSLQESLGPSSAGGLVALGSDGLIDQSMLPASEGGGGKMVIPKRQLFINNGNWTKPANFIEGTLRLTGIGGGSSGTISGVVGTPISKGGNSGEYVYRIAVDVSDIATEGDIPVIVGTGGTSVTATTANANLAGIAGTPTSFGTKVVLAGGPAPASINQSQIGTFAPGGVAALGTNHRPEPATSPQCPLAGSGGKPVLSSQPLGVCGGAGGLILDATGITAGGGGTMGSGGTGYGAGGGAGYSGSVLPAYSGAGADGALLLEWLEVVE